ncbi:helix-turn-helix domain-containing protein [Streptomyces sp. Tu 6176]|uniref:helix-turn-helix domain-containing protein n=1 Tax=Streptomyces sp. Tu 6176 TaxID=1470557 RepID=UPI003B640D45
MKMLRLREGLEREEFGRRLGYSASTIASFEQGRRIPTRGVSALYRPTRSKGFWLPHSMGSSDHRLSVRGSQRSSSKGCWERHEQR